MKAEPKIIKYLSKDPVMKEIIRSTPLALTGAKRNVFNALVSSIISQQLSVKVASVIHGRVLTLFKTKVLSPKMILDATEKKLLSAGLSNQKMRYLKNIAEYFNLPGNKRIRWSKLEDDEIIERLTTIKGVGVWTVQMILMFTLDRPDIFPSGDLGIQLSMKQFYGIKKEKKELIHKMEKIAANWSPYRTTASIYLWAARDK